MHPQLIAQVLFLIALANGAPVIAKRLLRDRFASPVDRGWRLPDGQPVFGGAKTIRGIVLSVIATTCLAPAIGAAPATGAIVAVSAMTGDLLSSFTKRRMRLPSSSMCIGIDQGPESLLPALACRWILPLSLADVALVVALFLVGELGASRLLYALTIRDQPY